MINPLRPLLFGLALSLPTQALASVTLKALPAPIQAIELTLDPGNGFQVDHQTKYEDCVESVLLRLIQAFAQVHPEKLSESSELRSFSEKHHLNWTKDFLEGIKSNSIRMEWADWLSNRPFFVYGTEGRNKSPTHELKSTWPNIRSFFLHFWPKIPNISNTSSQESISDICSYFGKEWQCKIESDTASQTYKRNGEEVTKHLLTIRISYQSSPYLQWEVEQVFRDSDQSRVTGDTRLVDLRNQKANKDN